MSEVKTGWTGDKIPLELQTVVMVKYFEHALRQIMQDVAFMHKDLVLSINNDAAKKIEVLGEHQAFLAMMDRFQGPLGYEKYGDAIFRKTAQEVMKEALDELLDMIVYVSVAMWINDGADFPEGVMEEVAGSDEEE